jgi:signal transduction histidine kinase
MDMFIYASTLALFFGLFSFLKNNLYKNLFLHTLDGVSIIKNDKVIDCNDALVRLFGHDNKKDFLNIHPLKLSPLYQPDGEFSLTKANKMFEVAKEVGSVSFDWVFLAANNDEKWIQISIVKSSNYLAKNIYFMIWRNINQRKQIEEELKNLNTNLENIIETKTKELMEKEHMLFMKSKQAQMGEMISMIAHQWRQPLASIAATVIDIKMKIYFKKLKEVAVFDENFIEYINTQLNDIESFTQNLTHTIDDFRDFYKPQTQKQSAQIKNTIGKAYNIVKDSLTSSDIVVNMDFSSQKYINYYESEIIHIFLNLFSNTSEYFEEQDTQERFINIVTKDTNDGILVTFEDSGGGICEENLDKIFSPYFTTKGNGIGTGLGLYMSKKILLEHHQGDITVKNSQFGASFTVEIKDNG